MFFKISVLKNFTTFVGKHLRWSLFLSKLLACMPAALVIKDSNASVLPWILRNFYFKNSFSYRRTRVAAFEFSYGEWFCQVTFCQDVFTIKKLFYDVVQSSSEMLSLLHR